MAITHSEVVARSSLGPLHQSRKEPTGIGGVLRVATPAGGAVGTHKCCHRTLHRGEPQCTLDCGLYEGREVRGKNSADVEATRERHTHWQTTAQIAGNVKLAGYRRHTNTREFAHLEETQLIGKSLPITCPQHYKATRREDRSFRNPAADNLVRFLKVPSTTGFFEKVGSTQPLLLCETTMH
ncbi:hypothetical protein F2P79_025122 [Pimephales promelas]|nr:hypothetical protein F2P79_025122 [Pimephales promelas]